MQVTLLFLLTLACSLSQATIKPTNPTGSPEIHIKLVRYLLKIKKDMRKTCQQFELLRKLTAANDDNAHNKTGLVLQTLELVESRLAVFRHMLQGFEQNSTDGPTRRDIHEKLSIETGVQTVIKWLRAQLERHRCKPYPSQTYSRAKLTEKLTELIAQYNVEAYRQSFYVHMLEVQSSGHRAALDSYFREFHLHIGQYVRKALQTLESAAQEADVSQQQFPCQYYLDRMEEIAVMAGQNAEAKELMSSSCTGVTMILATTLLLVGLSNLFLN